MIVGIMQPYFFPYIGYWQLIHAVDTFVIYDDVHFIKQGYINRNSILMNNRKSTITLQLAGASSNKLINEVNVGNNSKKLIKSITQNYKKAPEYQRVFPLINSILENSEKELAKFLGNSIKKITEYLEIDINIIYSSDIEKDSTLKAQDKILDICQQLGASHYINAIGGQDLYSKEIFRAKELELDFIQSELIEYKQFKSEFVPYLSIIDIMMFNQITEINDMLNKFRLV